MTRAAAELGRDPPFKSTVYRWESHKTHISRASWRLIEKAAELEGVRLPADVYCPREL
jgi:hypothetical protein